MLDVTHAGIVGMIVAAAAAVWPALGKIKLPDAPATTGDSYDRAHWVNDLFALATVADAKNKPDVAAAARALIAALIADKDAVAK